MSDQIFDDGYWVVICDQLDKAKTAKDVAYYAQINFAEQVYITLQKNAQLRDKLLDKCGFNSE